MPGKFIISLDVEKKWGLLDIKDKNYENNIHNVPYVIDSLLQIFERYNIKATWAVVASLIISNEEEFLSKSEKRSVFNVIDESLNATNYFEKNDYELNLFSAFEEIYKILGCKGQEIISHSYCHAYFSEEGMSTDALSKDYIFSQDLFKSKFNHNLSPGIVFPRNQVPYHLDFSGYQFYRSNCKQYLDRPVLKSDFSFFFRILRVLDSYVKISGYRDSKPYVDTQGKVAIPASRFLRPFTSNVFLEKMKLRRIKREMTVAAIKGEYYHLWWHPHNFGNDVKQNIRLLDEILQHYKYLSKLYDMKSVTMGEVYENFK